MARTKSKLNKAQAIRDYITANPNAGPTEVAKALSETHKTKFAVAQVSNVKNAGKQKAKRGPKPTKLHPGNIVSNGIVAAVEYVQVVGGLKNAKQCLRELESLLIG